MVTAVVTRAVVAMVTSGEAVTTVMGGVVTANTQSEADITEVVEVMK